CAPGTGFADEVRRRFLASANFERVVANRGVQPAANWTTESKALDGFLLVPINGKQADELDRLENFLKPWINAAEREPASAGFDSLMQCGQLAKHGAGQALDVAEIQNDFPASRPFGQAVQSITDGLDRAF